MKFIIDSNGFYIGFGGSNTQLQEGQLEAPFPPQEGQFYQPKWNGEMWIEGGTEEEVLEYISTKTLSEETEQYIKRISDGAEAIAKFSAELRVAKLNGSISEEGHKVIDKALKPIRDEVLAGQWISAKDELILLGTDIIGQALYDRIYIEIDNYIQQNY